MANQHERPGDSIFDHLTPMRTTDRVTLYLMQQLGIQTDSEPIVLNQEEEARLAQIQQKNRTEDSVKNLVNEILTEVPNITEEELRQILLAEDITEPELVDLAIQHYSHRQIMGSLKPMRFTDPKTIELLHRLGIKTE